MVLDRRSLSYAALGLGPSWFVLDGIFAEVALFDRTQPEGLALATYLTAVSAVANTIVVPGHAVVQRRVQWSLRTWVGGAVYAQLATALVLAAFWHARAGGASVALYLCVFATSLVGNFQQLALNPWAAETGRATRIVELMAGGNAGALLPAFLALLQRVDSVRREFGPTPFFLCLSALLLLPVIAFHAIGRVAKAAPGETESPKSCELSPQHGGAFGGPSVPEFSSQHGGAFGGPSAPEEITLPQHGGSFGGPAAPEEITLDDDDEEEDATWAETRLLSLKMPPLSRRVPDEDREARTQECRRLAYSGAYYQLASWVLLRSFLPYAASLTAPEASKDGAAYLAVAVSGSLITCFVGALFAMRRDAPINVARSDAVVTAGCLAVALASLVCGVAGRPKNPVAALVVVFATWIVRFLDGYCSPLFYRRIHTLSESIDVLQWAGVVAIWVVNAGVWLSLAVVLGVEN